VNPCTQIASAYPRHENIDFTAPELDFDGLVGSGDRLPVVACYWVPWASIGCLERNGLNLCYYPPIDYDPNSCKVPDLTYWSLGKWDEMNEYFNECEESDFSRKHMRVDCWTWNAIYQASVAYGCSNPCDIE
jgi:hypothetical protein